MYLVYTPYPYYRILSAVCLPFQEGQCLTGDLGGSSKCSEFTDTIIRKLE